jgi:GcrA cell cycle regulator
MTKFAWTDDRIGRLKTLWLVGWTADQIARELQNGISRSAVLGKVHRLGLSARRPGRPPVAQTAAPRAHIERLSSKPVERAAARVPGGGQTILTVGRGQCRWPYGDPGREGARYAAGRWPGAHSASATRRWAIRRRRGPSRRCSALPAWSENRLRLFDMSTVMIDGGLPEAAVLLCCPAYRPDRTAARRRRDTWALHPRPHRRDGAELRRRREGRRRPAPTQRPPILSYRPGSQRLRRSPPRVARDAPLR